MSLQQANIPWLFSACFDIRFGPGGTFTPERFLSWMWVDPTTKVFLQHSRHLCTFHCLHWPKDWYFAAFFPDGFFSVAESTWPERVEPTEFCCVSPLEKRIFGLGSAYFSLRTDTDLHCSLRTFLPWMSVNLPRMGRTSWVLLCLCSTADIFKLCYACLGLRTDPEWLHPWRLLFLGAE